MHLPAWVGYTLEAGTPFPREHEVGKLCAEAAWTCGFCWGPRPRGGRQPCATSAAAAEAGPGSRGGAPPTAAGCAWGTVAPRPGTSGGLPPRAQSGRGPGTARSAATPRACPGAPPSRPHTDPHTLTPAPAVPDSDPGLGASLGAPRGVQVAEPAPRGGGASARASPRGGEGKGGAGRRRPAPGDRPGALPARPRTVLMRGPSLYSGRGRRALRTRAQRGGSDSGAEPWASGAGP